MEGGGAERAVRKDTDVCRHAGRQGQMGKGRQSETQRAQAWEETRDRSSYGDELAGSVGRTEEDSRRTGGFG